MIDPFKQQVGIYDKKTDTWRTLQKLYNIPTLGSVKSTHTCYRSQYWNKLEIFVCKQTLVHILLLVSDLKFYLFWPLTP